MKVALAPTAVIDRLSLFCALRPNLDLAALRISDRITAFASVGPLLLLIVIVALGWYGVRPLFRAAERSFWSLNSLAIQPGYALCREGLRNLVERFPPPEASEDRRARVRAATALGAEFGVCAVAAGLMALAWPPTRRSGEFADLALPQRIDIEPEARTAFTS